MILHAATGFHAHEFSPSNSTPRRLPLRPTFSTSNSISSTPRESMSSSGMRPVRRAASLSRKNSDRVSFQEPELESMLEDGTAYQSEGSATTANSMKRRRESSRTSTVYLLAHPAPTLTREQKVLLIRPKLIFQLQRISSATRPTPIIDVMPSTVVVPRIMKKFPRMFRGKRTLGTNDVVIVKSEDYITSDDSGEEDTHADDSLGNREILGVICQRASSRDTEICLSDGSVWHATSHGKNSYEFETTDMETGETTKARWVQRISPRRQESSGQQFSGEEVETESPKFIFSIIQASSRRHPILASLTRATLDIPDTYTTCSSSAGRYPPISPIRAQGAVQTEDDPPVERSTHTLDDNTKILIQITGIWVALKIGWSSYFNFSDRSPGNSARPGAASNHRARSASMDHGKPSPLDTRTGTPESENSLGVGAKILRTKTGIFNRSPSSVVVPTFDPLPSVPKRAVSTGTAFMKHVAARRLGPHSGTVPNDSEGEMTLSLPDRAATTNDITPNGMRNKRMSTPSPLALFESDLSTPETPTRPHPRIQPTYFPSSPLKTQADMTTDRSLASSYKSYPNGMSSEVSSSFPGEYERKGGKWRQLIGFFRRGNRAAN